MHPDPDVEHADQSYKNILPEKTTFINEIDADSAIFYADCRIANTFDDAHV